MRKDKVLPEWGEPLRFLTDDRDHDERFEIVIYPGGNGDWYVSVLPEGHRMGPAVRISTSGGASRAVPGLGIAIARAYRALRGEKIEDCFEEELFKKLFQPVLANNHNHFKWCHPGDSQGKRWMLLFDDQDVGPSFFDDQQEAYDAYSNADTNWNCHLFVSATRDPQKVEGVETSAYLWQNVITGSRTISFNRKVTEEQRAQGWRVYPLGIIGDEIHE